MFLNMPRPRATGAVKDLHRTGGTERTHSADVILWGYTLRKAHFDPTLQSPNRRVNHIVLEIALTLYLDTTVFETRRARYSHRIDQRFLPTDHHEEKRKSS